MSLNHDDDRLGKLLNQWADQASDSRRLGDLRDRIVCSLAETEPLRVVDAYTTPERGTTQPAARSLATGVVVACAAMLLVSLAFIRVSEQARDDSGPTPLSPPDYAWLRDDQLQEKTALFSAMEEMFDGQLAWVAESRDGLELGLGRSSPGLAVRSKEGVRLAVRVVVERRRSGTERWQLVWAVDVLSQDEEVVSTTPGEDGYELRLWTYRLPDGQIAIDSEIKLAGNDSLHALSSGLQQDRKPVRVADVLDRETEYRVFQTVAVLNGEVS